MESVLLMTCLFLFSALQFIKLKDTPTTSLTASEKKPLLQNDYTTVSLPSPDGIVN